MKASELHDLLDEILLAEEPDYVATVLENLKGARSLKSKVLTIVANAGIHEIPKMYLRGEIYEASRGNWDSSSEEALLFELTAILRQLAQKLRARQWERVYLIPTGHPVLSLQIKVMVYRLLRFNTIDLYYRNGTYFEVNLDQRAIALEAPDSAKD